MIGLYGKSLNFLDYPNIQVDFLKINGIPKRMFVTKIENGSEGITIENEAFNNYYDIEKRKQYLEILESEINDVWFLRDVLNLVPNF